MSEQSDIRWKQRFVNFEKAFLRLKEAVDRHDLNELERNGLVQRFEFTLEMAWKTLKDFLEDKNFEFKASPKDTFRLAQESGYIDYAQELIDGLELRNLLSHDYSGEKFLKSELLFRVSIYPKLESLYHYLKSEL
jgi:nucleotidyltransferase substrate binding protein (TIGR01987 family)